MKKGKLSITVPLPNPELTEWMHDQTISVRTEFDAESSYFSFHLTIPKYIYQGVVDKEEKYGVELTKKKNSEKQYFEKNEKFFNQKMKSYSLGVLVQEFRSICADAITHTLMEHAESSKWLAVIWSHSHRQNRDPLNFADKGMSVGSAFQWWVAFKIEAKDGGFDNQRLWRSNKRIRSEAPAKEHDHGEWHYYMENLTDMPRVKLIPWTQEREDFLALVEQKFVSLNSNLDNFLGDLTEEKLDKLMISGIKLLNS